MLPATLVALLVLLGWPRPVSADTALWQMVTLPGGRAALMPRLGLRPDVPRAIAIAEIIRVVHQARDPRGPIYTALDTYLASPPATGDELVPFPLPSATWRDYVLSRAVDDRHLLAAILLDHRAALICYGLYGLDEETLAFIQGQPSLLRRLYEQNATAFASFAHLLHVRGTTLELPGGQPAVAVWEKLLDAPPSDAAAAIVALLTRDNGRLAYFAEACGTLDSARVQQLLLSGATPVKVLESARASARAFIDVDSARNLTDLPFQRVAYDPVHLLEQLPIGPDGLSGTENYWKALLDNADVSEKGASEWTDLDDGPPARVADVLNRLSGLAYEARHDLIDAVAFAGRLGARLPSATSADRVYLTHACMRYPALMLTLERIGIDQLPAWNAVAARAALLDNRVSSRDASEDPLVLFQAAVALVDRAVQVGSMNRDAAAAALTALAAVDTGAADGARRLAGWLETDLIPAAAGTSAGAVSDADTALLEAMAGVGARKTAPPQRVRWEDADYRVDPAAAEHERLAEVRRRQGGNTLDLALRLTQAGDRLAHAKDVAAVGEVRKALEQAHASLVPIEANDLAPELAPPDVAHVVAQAIADCARVRSKADVKRAGGIAARLSHAENAVLAEVLMSFVYAFAIGDPDGQVFLAGNVARRHDFGRRASSGIERERVRWQLPEEASGTNEPWHVRGALLALDIGLGRLALRRTSLDIPAQGPRLNEGDRHALIASMVLMPADVPDDAAPMQLVHWLADGRRVVARLADATAREQARARLGLDTRRSRAVEWTALHDPGDLERLFLTTEVVQLGRPDAAAPPPGWGPAETAWTGCLCRSLPDPPAPHRAESRPGTGLLAAHIGDVELRVLDALAAHGLPMTLARGVVAAALQDYLDDARPAYTGDWFTLAAQARDMSDDHLVDEISALTARGALIPADAGTDGHP